MKKQLFMMALATLALASCSKDEPVSINKGNAIDFRAAMQTRATEMTTANIQDFFVTALDKDNANYFTDVKFTRDGQFFTSTPVYYWPGDGSTLDFYAYWPSAADLGGTLTIDGTTKTLADFSPAAAIADQKDFIAVHATGSKANESTGVALTFAHRLSQIEIKAKNANTGYVYKVTGVRIAKPVSKGTFDFGTTAWTLGTDKAVYDVTYASARTLGADAQSLMAEENDNAMLIPQQLTAWDSQTDASNANNGAYLAVLINLTTKDGAKVYPFNDQEYGWAAVPVGTKWDAGKKYVYTLDFSKGAGEVDPTDPTDPGEPILGGPIKFTVEVEEWQPVTEDIEM